MDEGVSTSPGSFTKCLSTGSQIPVETWSGFEKIDY